MSFNDGEIGAVIRVDAGEDISSATSVLIKLQPEIGTEREFTATVPGVDVTVGDTTYSANEYAEYTTISEDDLDYAGRWNKKVESTFSSTDIRQTNYRRFRVLP